MAALFSSCSKITPCDSNQLMKAREIANSTSSPMLSLALHNRMRSAGQNSKSPATESDSESESENLMEHNVPVADLLHLDSPKKKTKKTKKSVPKKELPELFRFDITPMVTYERTTQLRNQGLDRELEEISKVPAPVTETVEKTTVPDRSKACPKKPRTAHGGVNMVNWKPKRPPPLFQDLLPNLAVSAAPSKTSTSAASTAAKRPTTRQSLGGLVTRDTTAAAKRRSVASATQSLSGPTQPLKATTRASTVTNKNPVETLPTCAQQTVRGAATRSNDPLSNRPTTRRQSLFLSNATSAKPPKPAVQTAPAASTQNKLKTILAAEQKPVIAAKSAMPKMRTSLLPPTTRRASIAVAPAEAKRVGNPTVPRETRSSLARRQSIQSDTGKALRTRSSLQLVSATPPPKKISAVTAKRLSIADSAKPQSTVRPPHTRSGPATVASGTARRSTRQSLAPTWKAPSAAGETVARKPVKVVSESMETASLVRSPLKEINTPNLSEYIKPQTPQISRRATPVRSKRLSQL